MKVQATIHPAPGAVVRIGQLAPGTLFSRHSKASYGPYLKIAGDQYVRVSDGGNNIYTLHECEDRTVDTADIIGTLEITT